MREYGYRSTLHGGHTRQRGRGHRRRQCTCIVLSYYFWILSPGGVCPELAPLPTRGNWGRGCAVQSMSPRGITSHRRLVTELDWLVAVVGSSIISCKTTSFAGQVSCASPLGDALFCHDGFLLVPESELHPYKLRYCPLQRTTEPPPPHQRARCWLGGPLLDRYQRYVPVTTSTEFCCLPSLPNHDALQSSELRALHLFPTGTAPFWHWHPSVGAGVGVGVGVCVSSSLFFFWSLLSYFILWPLFFLALLPRSPLHLPLRPRHTKTRA